MSKIKLVVQQEEQELDVTKRGERLVVRRGEQEWELTVQEVNGSAVTLMHNGRLIHLAGARDAHRPSHRQLWVNGRTIRYERIEKRGGGQSAEKGSLSASIPAVVSAVLVQVGDGVQAGDKLILLESMKMILPITAPEAGTVMEIRCAVGDSVQPAVPLIVLS
jgi:biotin carboxyl carrier protein